MDQPSGEPAPPQEAEALLEHRDWVASETLAEDVEVGDELAVRKAR